MREDPIVYEDWKIGFSKFFDFRMTKSLNLSTSLIISLLNLYMGVRFEISFVVFLWTFCILIATIVEGIFDQINRSLIDRTIFAFGLIAVYFISFPNSEIFTDTSSNPLYHIIMGLLFAFKLLLIPISESTIKFSENILVPKNKKTESLLHDQIDRLKTTEYEMDTKEDFISSLSRLRSSILTPLASSIAFATLLTIVTIIFGVNFELIRDFVVIILLILSGISLSAIIFIDYLERRKEKLGTKRYKPEFYETLKEEVGPAK